MLASRPVVIVVGGPFADSGVEPPKNQATTAKGVAASMTLLTEEARSFDAVVVVADIFEHGSATPTVRRRDLEKTERSTLDALMATIQGLGFSAHHYESPRDLALNADRHQDDLVLSIFGGETSRNRMALVPAVCEVFGLRYIGPDTYGRIICQDKVVSKQLAERVGFKVPAHVILSGRGDLGSLEAFSETYILKPISEGSSIGLEQRCVIRPGQDGAAVARDLMNAFGQPVMAEAFVPGREVSYNFIKGQDRAHIALSEIVVDGRPDFFSSNIFDASEKLLRTVPRRVANIDAMSTERDRRLVQRLADEVGTLTYCRVDGKWVDGGFVFLEITPDAWIDAKGAFSGGFIEAGWSYDEVIAAILASPAHIAAAGGRGATAP